MFMKASEDILARVKIKDMKPFPRCAPVLEELTKNHCLIVISSNDYASIKEALDLFNYDEYFRKFLAQILCSAKKKKYFMPQKNIMLR